MRTLREVLAYVVFLVAGILVAITVPLVAIAMWLLPKEVADQIEKMEEP